MQSEGLGHSLGPFISSEVLGLSCRQNAELAKLRQELSKVSKELSEKAESARQEEQQRKALETKAAALEKQVLQLQVSWAGSPLCAPFTVAPNCSACPCLATATAAPPPTPPGGLGLDPSTLTEFPGGIAQ